MLKFERVDMDPGTWSAEIAKCPEHTVFQTHQWLSFVAKTQHAEPVIAALKEGQQIVGYFAGLIVRKFGLRILGSPLAGWTTSYMGLCLTAPTPRRMAVEALIRFAFEDLRCVHFEFMDRSLTLDDLNSLGFGHRIFAGFEVDLTQTEKQLLAKMSDSCRWSIRKAEKQKVFIEEAHDLKFADDYYAQLEDVFAKQSLVPTYGVERVRELIREVHPTGMLLLLRARNPEGRCIATGIFAATNRIAYFWGGASWRHYQSLRPNELIQWYAMKYWKGRGIRSYDMGGSGEYKRKYGGVEIYVPWVRKSKYRSLSHMRDIAQQLVRSRQRLSGKWKTCASSCR